MSTPDPRTQTAFNAATKLVQSAVQAASEHVWTHLGALATSSHRAIERDAFMTAQLDLRKNMEPFFQAFNEVLFKRLERGINPAPDARRSIPSDASWTSLSLVNDSEIEEQMFADRISQTIGHACEWELRELSAYIGTLLGSGQASPERNPFRPEVIGAGVLRGISACSQNIDTRKLLAKEFGVTLARDMPPCYAEMLKDFKDRGITPLALSVKGVDGPGNELNRDRVNSGYDTLHDTSSSATTVNAAHLGHSGYTIDSSALPQHTGPGGRDGHARQSGFGSGRSSASRSSGSGSQGLADAELMTLIRRLTFLTSRAAEISTPGSNYGPLGQAIMGGAMSQGEALSGMGIGSAGAGAGSPQRLFHGRPMHAVNLIHAHREALQQASTGTLDHMVIDVVGSLFDQILSDPRVPPQMARQIARLQLPVLRVALSDTTFFSSRKHPVRLFVNRIASLSCAFDDLEAGAGKQFLERVRSLVQEIVQGDFDQIDVYIAKLNSLESFVTQQAKETLEETNSAQAVVDQKESDLRVQQRYMQQLHAALTPISMQPYLRDFLAQVWSQALSLAAKQVGPQSDLVLRLKRAGRDLVMSVQPKGSRPMRQKFLLQLPPLMRDLNEGIALIGWPDAAKKEFFSKLLPAHAESLKLPPLTELEYNLLAKQLEGIFNIPAPDAKTLSRHDPTPLVTETGVPMEARFSPEEAKQIGLIEESAVNWDGAIPIDLDAQANAAAETVPGPLAADSTAFADTVEQPFAPTFAPTIEQPFVPTNPTHSTAPQPLPATAPQALAPEALPRIDPAPAPAESAQSSAAAPFLALASPDPEEPSQGGQLINHLQVGFAYQMNLKESWQKVRLTYISPGRTFFVFARGKGMSETMSLTSRMLARMCETGRFKAFESTYLIERASARARKQLAALGVPGKNVTTGGVLRAR
jgi:hypothetical protein